MRQPNPVMLGVLTSLLPMAVLVLVFVFLNTYQVREKKAAYLLGLTQELGMAVDNEVMTQIRQLEMLATINEIDEYKHEELHQKMIAAVNARPHIWFNITLLDQKGQLLLASMKPYGTALPKTGMPDQLVTVVKTAKPLAYGVLARGVLTTNSQIILIGVPVIREGVVKYVLQAAFKPDTLNRVFSENALPKNYLAMVLDHSLNIVTISQEVEKLAGQPAEKSITENLAHTNIKSFFIADLDGERTFFSSHRLANTGWTFVIGARADMLEEAPWQAMLSGFTVLFTTIIFSLSVAWIIARRDLSHRQIEATFLSEVQVAGNRAELAEEELIMINRNLEFLVEQKTAEIHLAGSVFYNTGEGVIITDHNAIILSVNPAFNLITGYSADEAIGHKVSLLASHHHDENFYREMWDCLIRQGHWEGEIWNRRKCSDIFLQRTLIDAVKDKSGQTTHYVAVFNDITDAKSKDVRIRHMAYHDALTGLPNRLMLEDRLQQGIAAAYRGRTRLGLLFIDLDRFKNVNDHLGHSIGDFLLREVGDLITACKRSADTLARLGGDEFVVIMIGVETPEECAILGRKIIRTLSQPIIVLGHSIHISASVGIAVYPDDGGDCVELMKCADTAMYAAKDAGRGVFRYFQATMSERATQRMEIETRLRHALDNGELSLHYQPKLDASSRITTGFEALLRWNNPSIGMVPPDEFIPIAEDTGFIKAIGNWVINEACRQISTWQKEGYGLKHIAINVSARQLYDGTLVEQIVEAINRHDIPATTLEIELTESMVMANPEEAAEIFSALRELGVRVSIDDFGTGFSSLAYLRRLPIDVIKIDRSFVMHADTNSEAAGIICTIVALGKILGLEVVAEGVETDAQAALLTDVGCDILQGFLFSRPLRVEDVELLPYISNSESRA
jgi:diguanylate cyclase (GGDEF)-like protein/PAS domain S-box-containing protein